MPSCLATSKRCALSTSTYRVPPTVLTSKPLSRSIFPTCPGGSIYMKMGGSKLVVIDTHVVIESEEKIRKISTKCEFSSNFYDDVEKSV